jgi:hypothetical protein
MRHCFFQLVKRNIADLAVLAHGKDRATRPI